MYGNVNTYEMKMPAHYVDMTAEEMEYDGAWGFFKSICKAVTSAVKSAAENAATFIYENRKEILFYAGATVAVVGLGVAILPIIVGASVALTVAGIALNGAGIGIMVLQNTV